MSLERLEITPESRVILFSDGVVEQPGAEGLYGLERAIDALGLGDSRLFFLQKPA